MSLECASRKKRTIQILIAIKLDSYPGHSRAIESGANQKSRRNESYIYVLLRGEGERLRRVGRENTRERNTAFVVLQEKSTDQREATLSHCVFALTRVLEAMNLEESMLAQLFSLSR